MYLYYNPCEENRKIMFYERQRKRFVISIRVPVKTIGGNVFVYAKADAIKITYLLSVYKTYYACTAVVFVCINFSVFWTLARYTIINARLTATIINKIIINENIIVVRFVENAASTTITSVRVLCKPLFTRAFLGRRCHRVHTPIRPKLPSKQDRPWQIAGEHVRLRRRWSALAGTKTTTTTTTTTAGGRFLDVCSTSKNVTNDSVVPLFFFTTTHCHYYYGYGYSYNYYYYYYYYCHNHGCRLGTATAFRVLNSINSNFIRIHNDTRTETIYYYSYMIHNIIICTNKSRLDRVTMVCVFFFCIIYSPS